MSVPAAYLAVIAIWSTTPLAVKWSGEGPGFLFGALGRMTPAAAICPVLLAVLREKLPWHQAARRSYAAGSVGAYGALLCVYWGAQRIPSGMIAVLFGLTPIVTGVLARTVLNERGLTPGKLLGALLGLAGLALILGATLNHEPIGMPVWAGAAQVLSGLALHQWGTALWRRMTARARFRPGFPSTKENNHPQLGKGRRHINADPKGEARPLHESVVLVKGAGHFVAQEKPAEFNHALERIVSDLVVTGGAR